MRRWQRFSALLLAFALLAAVWLVVRPAGAPLYDGIQLVIPYRYLHTPPDQPNVGPPGSAHITISVTGGNSAVAKIHTDDPQVPQAYLILKFGALAVPPALPRVMLTIQAVNPPAPAPKDRTIDGNVYRFAATTPDGRSVNLRPGHVAVVELLGTGASGTAAVARYGGGRWVPLNTSFLSGQGYFVATTTSLGEFTLILTPHTTSALATALPFIIAAVVLLLVLAVGVLQIRLVRRRQAASS